MNRLWIVLLVLAVACATAICLASLRSPWRGSRPHTETRNAVAAISPDDVAKVELEVWQWRPIGVVKDREIIRLLVAGLKEATVPYPTPSNRTDKILLHLRNGRTVGPFRFSLDGEEDAFSLQFVEGLKKAGAVIPRQHPE